MYIYIYIFVNISLNPRWQKRKFICFSQLYDSVKELFVFLVACLLLVLENSVFPIEKLNDTGIMKETIS